MLKDKAREAGAYILEHSKILFPVIVIAAVAVTVTIALSAGGSTEDDSTLPSQEGSMENTDGVPGDEYQDIPMEENTDEGIGTLIRSYYDALAEGDTDALSTLCHGISQQDLLRFGETASYIQSYPVVEIYTKPGLEEGTKIAYVYSRVILNAFEDEISGYQTMMICKDEQGQYYINRGEFSAEVQSYIERVSAQDDVVVFNNRVNTEYNDLMYAKPEIFEYLSQLDSWVSTAVGERIAELNTEEGETGQEESGEDVLENGEGGNTENPETSAPTEPVILYATATTTVNVRSSDSENANRLGKITGGTKIQVLEQRVNGWTKVLYEGSEGFIKSEYLELVESADNAEVIGTVTATTNINVRASASETADRLGVLAGGETADLLANENGWCKINYNGQVGYVKADYVE
ncbi:MAG: SH3 domain-containing protein [Candidatus Gastranaerophilales bacterium]|nr:SH3 domain-containing protein [Candidatus Gastranaerophilales bacterium]